MGLDRIRRIWLAGFFDGEGMFTAQAKPKQFTPLVGVSNTHKPTIDYIHNKLGGNYQKTREIPNQKIVFALRWYSGEARRVAHYLLPFLVTKSRQAWLVANFPRNHRNGKKRETIKQQQIEYCRLLKDLNHRGSGDPYVC